MAFWGIQVKPGKPYAHPPHNSRGRLHVSQATLGIGSSLKQSLLQCNVGDKSPVLLCSLLPEKTESCPLNLEFEEVDEVIFSVIGPRSIHLTGYYVGHVQHSNQNDSETESYGEDIADTENDDSSYHSDDDEYEKDFIDDGEIDIFSPSPLANGKGEDVEIDNEKPKKRNHNRHKRLRKKYEVSESEDDTSQPHRTTNGSTVALETEDEDHFPISSLYKSEVTESNTKLETEPIVDNSGNIKPEVECLNGKVDTVVQDGQLERVDAQLDLLASSMEENIELKKKKRKRAKEEKVIEDQVLSQDVPMGDEKDHNSAGEKSFDVSAEHFADEKQCEEEKDKKKKKKKIKTHETEGDANLVGPLLTLEENNVLTLRVDEKNVEEKACRIRTLSSGLIIEELEHGDSDGKIASRGKKVTIDYTGKLKETGQIFNSTNEKRPQKFRLGRDEIIEGLEVGLDGMHVNGKRRLIIPPSMGYGSTGNGDMIPPNSWLVYEVELVGVR